MVTNRLLFSCNLLYIFDAQFLPVILKIKEEEKQIFELDEEEKFALAQQRREQEKAQQDADREEEEEVLLKSPELQVHKALSEAEAAKTIARKVEREVKEEIHIMDAITVRLRAALQGNKCAAVAEIMKQAELIGLSILTTNIKVF